MDKSTFTLFVVIAVTFLVTALVFCIKGEPTHSADIPTCSIKRAPCVNVAAPKEEKELDEEEQEEMWEEFKEFLHIEE